MAKDHFLCECGAKVLAYKKKEHELTERHHKKLRVVKLNNELRSRQRNTRLAISIKKPAKKKTQISKTNKHTGST